MKAIYTSVWDGNEEIETVADYDPATGKVFNIESVEAPNVDILEREYISILNGTELDVLDFDNFQEKWLEQECDSAFDSEQLKEEIGKAGDFEDLFQVIGLWSHTPLVERVNTFLKRNNACYREEAD